MHSLCQHKSMRFVMRVKFGGTLIRCGTAIYHGSFLYNQDDPWIISVHITLVLQFVTAQTDVAMRLSGAIILVHFYTDASRDLPRASSTTS